jgi:hypothetical protein
VDSFKNVARTQIARGKILKVSDAPIEKSLGAYVNRRDRQRGAY